MDLIEAKRLFFAYDGSYFYMTRDGVQEAYREAGVPPEVESAWLEELTQVKLQALRRKGNWWALYFLNRCDDHRHLAAVLEAEPMGVLWERCAFLEQLLKYARGCEEADGEPSMIAQAVQQVIVESERLLRRARSRASIDRIQAILTQARHDLDRD